MKILIVIDSLGSGGAERSTAVLADYLFEEKVDFTIICLDQKEVGVQGEMQKKPFNIQFLSPGNILSQAYQISSIVKKGKFDLVHSILFRSNIRTRLAKIFSNFIHLESLVNTTYSKERLLDEQVNQNALKLYRFLDRITAKQGVDHFHSITEVVKQHYVQEIGLKPQNITVIHRGRKPLLTKRQEKFSDPVHGTFKLINVGRNEFQKGQIYLLKAIKILKDKGYSFHLNILGRKGNVTNELISYIEKEGLEDFVSLEGFKNNVSEYLLNSDLFVFPSLYEGLGGALIEAQAAGLAIACNDIEVLHEVVVENSNAKFFDIHNVSSIVDALGFFFDNPHKLEEYGVRSLENFEKKFLESENNKKLLNLYKKLLIQD